MQTFENAPAPIISICSMTMNCRRTTLLSAPRRVRASRYFGSLESWGSTSPFFHGFVLSMDDDTRDLISHLGSRLTGIMEDASADAATLAGVPDDELDVAITRLARATASAQTIAAAMCALLQEV